MDISKLPCPVCGGTDYEIGEARFGMALSFLKQDQDSLIRPFLNTFFIDQTKITYTMARRCIQCNNVQLFIKQ